MDLFILELVQNHFHNGFTDFIFPIITMLGNAGTVWLLTGVCLTITKKYRLYGIMIFITLALTYTLGEFVLKPMIARPRPFLAFPGRALLIPPPNGYSFPSGHAGSSFSAAMILWRANKKIGTVGFGLAVLIAFSRVFLFVHYPSDVLAGAVLGVLCAFLTISVCQRLQNAKN